MKAHSALFALLIASLTGSIAQAQSTTPHWQVQRALAQVAVQPKQELQLKVFDGSGAIQYYGFTVRNLGAWWTNVALVTRLGLTDDQKAKIERAFENHRLDLESKTALLQKEEAQLTRLLESDPIDRNAVFTQIEHVIQARGELERTNSVMTLEMRGYLTRDQWLQLPRSVDVKKFIVAPKQKPQQ
jgi:Spy/CpxP family protein refolding chaperone